MLKIGGSVLTDKKTPDTINFDIIDQIAANIKKIYDKPELKFALVTGVGNVGHRAVAQSGAHKGDNGSIKRRVGLVKAQIAVNNLRNIVLEALERHKVPVFQFYTSSIAIADKMRIKEMYFNSVEEFLKNNIIPITSGDVIPDKTLGYSVMSGDIALQQMVNRWHPKIIVYGTNVAGVYNDDPQENPAAELLTDIKFDEIDDVLNDITQGKNIDVSGAMKGKFYAIKSILKSNPSSTVHIFDCTQPKNLLKIIAGEDFPHTQITH